MNLQKGVGKPSHSSSAVIDFFIWRIAFALLPVELLVQGKSPRAI